MCSSLTVSIATMICLISAIMYPRCTRDFHFIFKLRLFLPHDYIPLCLDAIVSHILLMLTELDMAWCHDYFHVKMIFLGLSRGQTGNRLLDGRPRGCEGCALFLMHSRLHPVLLWLMLGRPTDCIKHLLCNQEAQMYCSSVQAKN